MSFTYVDLFAGIGGFHAALSALGGTCVYAIENDPKAATIYQLNWGMNPLGDITQDVSEERMIVPKHDVLVAGFPCQPFSKSGAQRGMEETRGTLYWNILKIIQKRKPSLVLLENVRNLAGPRHKHEWQVIVQTLRDEGYIVSDDPGIFSPHLLPPEMGGQPQIRERVFIVAVRKFRNRKSDDENIKPVVSNKPIIGWHPLRWNLENDLPLESNKVNKCYSLSKAENLWISAWNDFVVGMHKIRDGERLPGFPLWGDAWVLKKNLRIPPGTPLWKKNHLIKNADFYTTHKQFIDRWTKKWNFYSDEFPPSRRKLEWQAQDSRNLWDTVMHLRPSGIRAKRSTYVPALVAITQTSIVGKRKRRLTVREAARLQGLPEWFSFGDQANAASYKQLGNGVCVGVVWHVVKQSVEQFEEVLGKTCPQLVQAVLSSPSNPSKVLNQIKSQTKKSPNHAKR